jgi:NAD(P)-dependent dehydrogenase (short-subunit alcohol dehydrogenase family)
MDKIDGPYYFFKLIQRMRQILPPWFPAIGLEGGRINIVPVDFVVAAIDHISHGKAIDGKCYQLVDPMGYRVGDVLDIFGKAAHAPKMSVFVNAALLGFIPKSVKKGLMALAPVRRIRNAVMKDLGLPDDILEFVNYPTRFDRRETDAALKGSGIECPNLNDYAWRLWDYWERHLDPDLFIDRTLKGTVGGKVVLVTGGSSGIGLAAACKFAEAGAVTIICARDEAKLGDAVKEIAAYAKQRGQTHPKVFSYSVDIADAEGCAAFVKSLEDEHGGVDFLINNAGRSIRRAIESSYDRFHDYERTMQLNYFGCLRVTMGLLPGMVKKHKAVVNISSIGAGPPHRAFLLRGQQGGARRVDALRLERIRRPRHHVHDDQHAAGAHTDDRTDQDLQQRRPWRPRKPDECAGLRPRWCARHLVGVFASAARVRATHRADR